MASEAAYDACDFTNSTTLVSAGGEGTTQYYLPCDPANSTLYISCSVGSHCASGQKVKVQVSQSERAVDESTGAALVHVTSLARVMTLLGAYEPTEAPGTRLLSLGYATELQANTTLDFIWCLSAHCPNSALTYDSSATLESCRADVLNLGGYISRSRPLPQFAHAEAYYKEALSEMPDHCPTLEYYTELKLMQNNVTAAAARATELCSRCGVSSGFAMLARLAFASAGETAVFDAACAFPPTAPPPPLDTDNEASPPPSDSAAAAGRSAGFLPTLLVVVSAIVLASTTTR